jgi:hypothetical protein
MTYDNNTGLPSTFAAIRDQNSMRPLLLSILEPGSRLNGKTLPNCHGLPLPKPYGIIRLRAEGLGWDNIGKW